MFGPVFSFQPSPSVRELFAPGLLLRELVQHHHAGGRVPAWRQPGARRGDPPGARLAGRLDPCGAFFPLKQSPQKDGGPPPQQKEDPFGPPFKRRRRNRGCPSRNPSPSVSCCFGFKNLETLQPLQESGEPNKRTT